MVVGINVVLTIANSNSKSANSRKLTFYWTFILPQSDVAINVRILTRA